MRHTSWQSTVIVCGLLSAVCVLSRPGSTAAAPVEAPRPPQNSEPAISPEMQQRLKRLIDQLDSDDYDSREQATAELTSIGRPAVKILSESAGKTSLEASSRVVGILAAIYRQSARVGEFTTTDAAEFALSAVAEAGNRSAAQRARLVLEDNSEIAEQRAIVEIRRLGGVIEHQTVNRGRFINVRPGNPAVRVPQQQSPQISHVVIGDSWTGGDEGLRHVARLRNLPALYVSRGKNRAPVSNRALASLQTAMPQLNIQMRGRAYLGVSGNTVGNGCLIQTVNPGKAAHRAGLQPGDVITSFDGEKIAGFEDLIESIKSHSPGDAVEVIIERNLQPVTLTVTLDVWQ
ncbi:MAG: PDZ domain-containing protein [Planctomycetaceae bacterium]|nr:PDZ domain-containing protein [Planctomycetaceae bacterium]